MCSSSPSPKATAAAPKSIGTLSLIVIGFFWVSGGVYGNETLLSAAPPLAVLLFTATIPLLFSLPSALLTAELATSFPSSGGQVVWVHSAFGAAAGAHNAYWLWLTNLLDAAVYPQMMMEYLVGQLQLPEESRRGAMFAIVAAVAAVSVAGIDWVSRTQGIMFVLTVGPCLLFVAIGLPKLDARSWVAIEGEYDGALLLSWCLWLYSGFAWLGLLAGEVSAPRRTYTRAMCALLPLVTALNMLPFLVAFSIDPDVSHYTAGYFQHLARQLAGPWLEIFFTIGANAALLGLYHSQTLAADTVLAAVAELNADSAPRCFRARTEAADSDAVADRPRSRVLACCRRFGRCLLAVPTAGGTPRISVLANAVVICFMLTLHYQALIEIEMMLYSLSHLLFFGAFIALRRQQPDVPRPLRVPGGVRTCLALMVAPTLICVAALGVNLMVAERAVLFGVAVGTGGVVHALVLLCARCCRRRQTMSARLLEERAEVGAP
mmetsp:Transcript_5033/g.10928  ORF Transcript_5033/g.10928 Transcript_5033/m.10928 type:complete len:491 (+) Transcript_5033:78-1550(+)